MALLAVRARHQSWWWLCFAAPAFLGCVVALGTVIVTRRANPEPFEFADIADVGDEVLGHVGSYLLPVIVDLSKSVEEVLIAGIIFALILQVHIATGRVHVNPLLYLFGYRTYRASTATGATYYLIARSDPADWSGEHMCAQVASSVLVERRKANPPHA